MYTKQNFIDSFINDIRIIKHLGTKVTPEMESFRPSDGQRSMLELLQYLSHVGTASIDMILNNDPSKFDIHSKNAVSVNSGNFAEAMDGQQKMMLELMDKFTDEDLKTIINLYGMGDKTKGAYLVDTIGKWFPTYRMQLFLYLKSVSVSNLGTMNMWAGMDAPQTK